MTTTTLARRRPTTAALAALAISLIAALALSATPPSDGAVAPAARGSVLAASGSTSATSGKPAQPGTIRLFTLSNRPDLVSGGDVIAVVKPIKGVRYAAVRLRLNGRDVTDSFAKRPGGRFAAYLTGLRTGRNVLTAAARGRTGRLVITNHPDGGPIFSGPQSSYYRCQPTARDAQCNEPAKFSLLYRSTNPLQAELQPYDAENPPSDVATTTTDRGVTVPFIVSREDGYQDRDRYTIITLFQPDEAWGRFRPQRQFEHKLLITHGGSCGASYAPADPPLADYSGTIPEGVPGIVPSYITALGKGFSVLSTALDNTGHNCNVATEAESLLMAKEHFVERYGSLRYTIGTGCSGGSIAQHTVANAYPGIYQGLLTQCSYPDTLSAGAQFADYHLMRLYFEDPAGWAPGVVWTPLQMAAVEGHVSILNSIVADEALFKSALDPENDCTGTVDPVAGDPSTRYDSEINPGGVRCSVLDIARNSLGVRPTSAWSEQEKEVGHGFGGIPFANNGVQYGLAQLRSGVITTQQFVDLNEQLGGLDINADPIPERIQGDPASVANAYRSGLLNEATNLDGVAMINAGGPDPGIAHDYAHAFWTEDRLQRAQGDTDNRVMWFGATPLIGDPGWANESLVAMDRWLRRVERDHSGRSLADKIARDKPADVTDRCANVPGVLEKKGADDEVDCVLPDSLQLRLSTPREQAGGDRLNDVLSCTLRPLRRSDYDGLLLGFSDAQWATMQRIFPEGVCDFDEFGQGQQAAQTWLTYSERGDQDQVVYGGRNLPKVQPFQADGWAAASFRSLIRE